MVQARCMVFVDRLPAWLEWMHATVAKVETCRRSMSFVEVREYAKLVGIDDATMDKRAADLEAAHRAPLTRRKKWK
jgi:predicted DNA-binding transcriptional regulator AlpA